MRITPPRVAAVACVAMILLLSAIQLFTRGPGMPPSLWLVFGAVWLFGAAMLWWFPTSGAIGTGLYGVILVFLLWRAHGLSGVNALIGIGSLVTAGLALRSLSHRPETM